MLIKTTIKNINKQKKRIFLLIIILVMVLYLMYKGFVYWNYNLFREEKQTKTWNSRVKKQRKMKQENKNKKVTLKTKTF